MLSALRSTAGRTIRNLARNRIEGVGHDFIGDIRSRLPHIQIQTIFDVGAHIGITALEFGDEFPDARVYAFEPGVSNFLRMKSNLIGKPATILHRIGFSSQPGTASLLCEPEHPSMARLVEGESDNTETITLDTIDRFCGNNGVKQIYLMKIDVEGHELQVLSGAQGLLSNGRISIIKLEVAIDPDLDYHTPMFDVCEFLHPLGYRLFGLYDEWECPLTNSPRLRRFDAAFISPEALNRPD
jgi:FkbM family methyltransferase